MNSEFQFVSSPSILDLFLTEVFFRIPAITSTEFYSGPNSTAQTACRCSTVFYALLMACGECQEASTTTSVPNRLKSLSLLTDMPIIDGQATLQIARLFTTKCSFFVPLCSISFQLSIVPSFPESIPAGTVVPHWAYLDVVVVR